MWLFSYFNRKGEKPRTAEEVAVRLADHENRLKVSEHRVRDLEENQKQIQDLTISVKELAISVKTMVEEQKAQGERIQKLEQEPAERWKSSTKALFNALLGAIGTATGAALLYYISSYLGG